MISDDAAAPARPMGVRTTRRRGRTSAAQQTALATLGPVWQIAPGDVDSRVQVPAGFGSDRPLLVDIGVGDGLATRDWAGLRPDADVLAVELHRPGIVKLLRALDADGPDNIRLIEGDALEVLDALRPASVQAVRVLFPDPWPKRRHRHRRLVDRSFVTTAARILEPGGELHVATDWQDYAVHITSMVATEPRFQECLPRGRPPRPITAYERRGLDADRAISDLVYRWEPADQHPRPPKVSGR